MGYVTVTTSEYIGDVSKSESIHFESFEDFMVYKEMDASPEAFNIETKVNLIPQEEIEGGWIPWNGENEGGPEGITPDTRIEVRLADGTEWTGNTAEMLSYWNWSTGCSFSSIVAYRVQNKQSCN